MWGIVAGAGVVDWVLLGAAACCAVHLLVLQAAKPGSQGTLWQAVQHQAETPAGLHAQCACLGGCMGA